MVRIALVLMLACVGVARDVRAGDNIFDFGKPKPLPATAPTGATPDKSGKPGAVAGGPESLLKAKGLARVGVQYLLETDAGLGELLRTMRAAKAKGSVVGAKRAAIEREIEHAKDGVLASLRDVQNLNQQLGKVSKNDPRRYNEILGQINAANLRGVESAKYGQDKEKELARLGGDGHDDYVGLVTALGAKMDAEQKEYAALAADAEVIAALESLNARTIDGGGGAKVKLGPSAPFAAELAGVRQARDMVASAAIKLTIENGTPCAVATINGKNSVKFTVDSGAAFLTLSADAANALGLHPGKNDPALTLVTAEGRHVEARLMTLTSVRLGPFTAANVACAVMPAGVNGGNLLGDSFLKNFVYRMDLAARELHLSPVGPQVTVGPIASKPVVPGVATESEPARTQGPASKPTSRPTTPDPTAPGPAPVAGIVDLLKLIDVKRDAVEGAWENDNGGKGFLVSPATGNSRLAIRYQPPEEYDFHTEFTRQSGEPSTVQIFTDAGHRCVWLVGWADRVRGFELIGGHDAGSNPTTNKGPSISNLGQRYASTVKVRKAGIQAYIDGKMVAEYTTDGGDLGIKRRFNIGEVPLGLATTSNQTVFFVVELREISGHGKPLP